MGWLLALSITYFVIQLFSSIAAVLLNSLIVIGLVNVSSLHTPSNVALGCMCCTDFLIGILSIPLWALNVSMTFGDSYQDNIQSYLAIAKVYLSFTGLSSLFMTLVNLDRFVAICYPFKNLKYVTLRLYAVIAICVFVIYMLLMGAAILLDMQYHSNVSAATFFTIFSITTIMLIVCNRKVLKVICRHRREIASVESNTDRNNARFQSETNRYRVIITLVILYVCCQVPQIITFLIIVCRANQFSISLYLFFRVSDILLLFNSFLNPLVYCLRIKSIRNAVKRVLSCQKHSENHLSPQ